jgi:tRNA A-37 threonylcarbamoyl transferase component Bud32
LAQKKAVVHLGADGTTAMLAKTEIAPPESGPFVLTEGVEIAGRYRILSHVGEGGMGTVYRALHLHLRKVFAVKVLHPRNVDRPDIAARFEREAIAAARIDHPNVVPATDFGQLPDGSFFLVMEFIDGRSLRAEVKSGAMRVPRALGIMRGVVSGVCAAHAKGIVHRDLKPENIMLVERDGRRDFVKLLDFGVAWVDTGNSRDGGPKVTEVGTMLGTPQYMSPEQILGRAVDVRSDLYSLGVVLFELVTGRCPFSGSLPELLDQHVTRPPPELPAALAAKEPRLAETLRVLLSKEPERRFQQATELAAALEAALQRDDGATRAREGTRANAVSHAIRSAGGFLRKFGRRVAPPAERLTSSMARAGSRGVARIRDRMGRLFRRRRGWRVALSQDRRVSSSVVAARRLGRQAMKSGNKLAVSARAGWWRAVEYCRDQWRLRARSIVIAASCLIGLGLVILLVVAFRGSKGTTLAESDHPDRSEKRRDRASSGENRATHTAPGGKGSPRGAPNPAHAASP